MELSEIIENLICRHLNRRTNKLACPSISTKPCREVDEINKNIRISGLKIPYENNSPTNPQYRECIDLHVRFAFDGDLQAPFA